MGEGARVGRSVERRRSFGLSSAVATDLGRETVLSVLQALGDPIRELGKVSDLRDRKFYTRSYTVGPNQVKSNMQSNGATQTE